MMNAYKGFRRASGDFLRAHAPACAAGLIVTTTSAILWADPAMASSDSSARQAGGTSTYHVLAAQVLIILAVGTLTFACIRLRSGGGRRAGGRRSAAHARSPHRTGSRTGSGGDPWMGRPAPPVSEAHQAMDDDDYPSWPGRPGPYALHPDHPSWPGRPDPRWASAEAALRADGYPSWPETHSPPRRGAEQPPVTALSAPVLPVRVRTGPTPGGGDIAPRTGPMLRERAAVVIDLVRPEDDRRPGPGQIWDGGSAQLASWILTEANQQAAEIRHEARDQATTSLSDAKQEAAELIRQAADQAAAKIEAAELQAAQLTAAVVKLSADLGGMAAYVAENLLAPALPATRPAARPAPEPAALPVAVPVAEPEAQPAARPARKTAGGKTAGGKNRQRTAMRVMTTVTAALVLFAVVCGTTEVALHGFRFFVFRSTGTGETGPSGLQEDQGPGQPDAPGAHR
jgi:hypothetical protein